MLFCQDFTLTRGIMETLNKSIIAPLKRVSSRCGIDGDAFIQRSLNIKFI